MTALLRQLDEEFERLEASLHPHPQYASRMAAAWSEAVDSRLPRCVFVRRRPEAGAGRPCSDVYARRRAFWHATLFSLYGHSDGMVPV